jgi:hypothetical protein
MIAIDRTPTVMLTTEELGDIVDVTAATLDEVLRQDAFGKFATLSRNDEEFIQTGNDWQPGEACGRFLLEYGSDPWVLEYRQAGKLYRADGLVTLDQVQRAFQSYLAGGDDWQREFVWMERAF